MADADSSHATLQKSFSKQLVLESMLKRPDTRTDICALTNVAE